MRRWYGRFDAFQYIEQPTPLRKVLSRLLNALIRAKKVDVQVGTKE
ncbi:hypothetical protein H0266_17610 [Halobacillus locisalis]|uniref:Uncharacterized protein n=1 Tax=Halobacillus locisalis TaxID=220753 RepID=A0A838CXZ4_9BACI|nr:hypothetical protein [Halobacillus locisalis]MBA2176709.1 hypothetical protein [Halobacillus locisalis]